MTPAARTGLLERLGKLSRHPLARAGLLIALPFVALMGYVRGVPVAPPRPDALPDLIARVASGPATITSQAALEDVGALASALVGEEGVTPGPFHVLFLPRLDTLEKFHHVMHGPFTGIRRMYCDVWVHSIVTYGAIERTWGFGEVLVRPALKLPILLFLLDRLGRGKTALGEYLGAPLEAVSGMDMHELPGRARLWRRVLAAADRHPPLIDFVNRQLLAAEPGWTDVAEVRFWSALARGPTRARLDELAAGRASPEERELVHDPRTWSDCWTALTGGQALGQGVGAAGEQRERR